MSSENEDGSPLDMGCGNSDVSKKAKLSYSREFLLSLSYSDSCKKLPSGFDESLISELEDGLVGVPDRPRIPGTFNAFRRSEYGVSPPTRGDGGNYSRGIHGKWDYRSSLRSDRASDERGSDSGRRFGHQNQRPWQSAEHEGLLGKGSFPRPSGYVAGFPAPKVRVNEPNQLNRSNEPYHPPSRYKAVPQLRGETDSLNDETFGSMECTSEDRAEAEKRRASFEMMRKEQQKALQEKQKLNLEKHKRGVISDICEALGESKEEKRLPGRNSDSEISGGIPISSNDLEKSSFVSHSPTSRPLVPPGFKSNTIEKSSESKPLVRPPLSQVGKSATVESLEESDAYHFPITNSCLEKRLSQKLRIDDGERVKIHPPPLLNKEDNVNLNASLGIPAKKSGKEDQLFQTSYLDSHATNILDPDIAEVNPGVLEDKNALDTNHNSSSTLEKILGCTLSVDDGQSNYVELCNGKPEDTSGIWSPSSVKSSKFVPWFFEEASAATDVSSSMPNDLLSLIANGDKANGVTDQVPIKHEESVSAILTCEDLEQSILSEYSAKTTDMSVEEVSDPPDGNVGKPGTNVDNHASLHLLSMLKKSTELIASTTKTSADIDSFNSPIVSQENDIAKIFNEHKGEENINSVPNLGRTLTLETLFGTAFMKELQSVEAPVSIQRGLAGPAPVDNPSEFHGLPFPVSDSVQGPNHGFGLSMSHTQCTKASEGDWLGFGNLPTREIPSKGVCFQLPEEDNLFSIGDTIDSSISNSSLSSNATINLKEKLGREGSRILPFPFNSYEKTETPIYRNMQMQQSSPGFHPTPQMPLARPLPYNHLDSDLARMCSQSKILSQDPTFNYDPHTNNLISPNMIQPSFPRPNARVPGFNIPSQNLLMHQMQMPGNHSPHFLGGFPIPQNGNQGGRFISEMNQAQGFPFGPHHPSTASRGMLIPGNPPDAFRRLLEMELQANSQQLHSLPPIHNQDLMRG